MLSGAAQPGDSAAWFVVAAAGVEGCGRSIPKPWPPKRLGRRWLKVEHADIGVDGESDLTLAPNPLIVPDVSQEQDGFEPGFVLYFTTSGSMGNPMTVS